MKNADKDRFTGHTIVPENGIFRQYWPNGNIRYEWYYEKGSQSIARLRRRKDGISKGWFENGTLKQIQTWKGNRKNGVYVQWYCDGQKRMEVYWKDNKKNGKCIEWYPSGQKRQEGYYKEYVKNVEGGRVGLWTEWYTNGQKKREGHYPKGDEEWISPDGELRSGKQSVVVWTEWNRDGKKKEG